MHWTRKKLLRVSGLVLAQLHKLVLVDCWPCFQGDQGRILPGWS